MFRIILIFNRRSHLVRSWASLRKAIEFASGTGMYTRVERPLRPRLNSSFTEIIHHNIDGGKAKSDETFKYLTFQDDKNVNRLNILYFISHDY